MILKEEVEDSIARIKSFLEAYKDLGGAVAVVQNNIDGNKHLTVFDLERLVWAVEYIQPTDAMLERKRILDYIDQRIEGRRVWADTDDGQEYISKIPFRQIPGLEDMNFIRHYVRTGGDYFEDTR